MARADVYFQALRAFGRPQTPGYSLSLVTDEEWERMAEIVNLTRVDIYEGEGQVRTHAVMPSWEYGQDNTYLADWTVQPVAGEQAAVALALAQLDNEYAALEAKANRTPADVQRMEEIERDRDMLQRRAYWQEAADPWGTGQVAIYRACNLPNVPFRLRSNWRLEADRPFTIRLHRCKPHEAQAGAWLRIRFGHWALILRQEAEIRLVRYKDGQYWIPEGERRGHWQSYNGQDFEGIEAVEEAIEALRDAGRLTAVEKAQIAQWQGEVREKQADLQKRRQSLSAEEQQSIKAEIAALKQRIEELKSSKAGLSAAQEEHVKRLKDEIIVDEADVTFQHQAESLFNRDIAITVFPQPRGYLVLHNSLGRDYYVYEDQEVTESQREAVIVGPTPVQVDGNGGSFWFSLSYVRPALTGYLRSEGHSTGADAVNLATLHSDATIPAGCRITSLVTPRGQQGFDWRVDFTSDGRRVPILYRLYMDAAATPRDTSREEVLFDSREAAPDRSFAWEVGFSKSQENRGRAATLTLTFPRRRYPQLLRLAQQQVRIAERECWFTGVISESPEIVAVNATMSKVTYRCYDRWALLRTARIASDVIGDGKTLGEYVRQLVTGIGLTSDEVIISGAATERVLPSAPPGKPPLLQPEFGADPASVLTRLLDDFGYRLDMWFDGEGRFHLEPQGTVTKPVIFSDRSRYPGDRHVLSSITETLRWDDYQNYIVVLGAQYHGGRYCAWWSDPESVDNPQHDPYVGRWLWHNPYENEALTSAELCGAACRWRAERYGRPRREWKASTWWDETLQVGDRVRYGETVVEILEMGADNRSAERMTITLREV